MRVEKEEQGDNEARGVHKSCQGHELQKMNVKEYEAASSGQPMKGSSGRQSFLKDQWRMQERQD